MEPKATKIKRTAYRVSEVAKMVGISAPVVYKMVGAGDIPHVKLGGIITIPAWWIDQTFERPVEGSATTGETVAA